MWIYNFIVVGDSYVGKSSFCNRLIFDKFYYDNPQTIGVDFFTKKITSSDIKIHLWDTAGNEMYKSITRNYFINATAVILIFDICNRDSFINLINYWIPIIKRECPHNVDIVIVGNKSEDIHRNIKYDEGKRLALNNNTIYFETECKKLLNESNILNVIDYLVLKVSSKIPKDTNKIPKGIKKINNDM